MKLGVCTLYTICTHMNKIISAWVQAVVDEGLLFLLGIFLYHQSHHLIVINFYKGSINNNWKSRRPFGRVETWTKTWKYCGASWEIRWYCLEHKIPVLKDSFKALQDSKKLRMPVPLQACLSDSRRENRFQERSDSSGLSKGLCSTGPWRAISYRITTDHHLPQ